jgi:hypothetical protein
LFKIVYIYFLNIKYCVKQYERIHTCLPNQSTSVQVGWDNNCTCKSLIFHLAKKKKSKYFQSRVQWNDWDASLAGLKYLILIQFVNVEITDACEWDNGNYFTG